MARRWIDAASAADLGKLDAQAIARVRAEAFPDATSADELHDALTWLTFLTEEEVAARDSWLALLQALRVQGRVARVALGAGRHLWVAAERRGLFEPQIPASDAALVDIVRGRLEGLGPVTVSMLAESLSLPMTTVATALAALEAEGFALRGQFTGASEEWCERRLLARIHRYTVKRLRSEIEPVSARDFLRFLLDWQHVSPGSHMHGSDALAGVLAQLEGYEAPAGAWESDVLPARIPEYEPAWLDEHCRAGRLSWARFAARNTAAGEGRRSDSLDANHFLGATQRASLVCFRTAARSRTFELSR